MTSLRKMGNWSFFIALMSCVRCIVYVTVAMGVVILVFVIAGLFSKVLAMVDFVEAFYEPYVEALETAMEVAGDKA